MTPTTGDRLQPRLRQLPRRIAPVQDETLDSYIDRLAAGNHLCGRELLKYLTRASHHNRARHQVTLASLAAVSGIPATHLACALPEMRPLITEPPPGDSCRTTAGRPNRKRPLCRLCTAAKGIRATVMIWACPEQNVCLPHNLWIGQGVQQRQDQLDVSDVPEIARAQIQHRHLVRRFGHALVACHFDDACEIEDWSSRNICTPAPRNDRRNYLLKREQGGRPSWSYYYAAQYPEVVRILSVISSPFWRRLAISNETAAQEHFYDEIDRKRAISGAASHNRPLRTWIQNQRNASSPATPPQKPVAWIVAGSR